MNDTQTWADLQDAGNAQAQLILLAIARHADWESGEAHPSRERIAKMAKCSKRTVNRYLDKLEADGFIERIPQVRGNGSQTANVYRLVGYAAWFQANRNGGQVSKPKAAEKYEEPGCQVDTPPVSDCQGGGDSKVARGGCQQVAPPERQLNNQLNSSAGAPATRGAARPSLEVKAGDISWAAWLDKIEQTQGAIARRSAEATGKLVVVARWPKDGSPVPTIKITGEVA